MILFSLDVLRSSNIWFLWDFVLNRWNDDFKTFVSCKIVLTCKSPTFQSNSFLRTVKSKCNLKSLNYFDLGFNFSAEVRTSWICDKKICPIFVRSRFQLYGPNRHTPPRLHTAGNLNLIFSLYWYTKMGWVKEEG